MDGARRTALQPATTLAVFDLTAKDCKAQPVIVSEVALVRALERMVKPDDNAENFYEKVIAVVEQKIKRSKHAQTEIEKLRGPFKELHSVCGGSIQRRVHDCLRQLPVRIRHGHPECRWSVVVYSVLGWKVFGRFEG